MSKTWKIIILIGIIAYFISVTIFEKLFNITSNHSQMNIYVPWGFIGIFISLYIFYEYNRVKKAKRNERREERNARKQELIDNILKANKKDVEG